MMSAYQRQLEVGLASSAAYGHALDCSLCLAPCARGPRSSYLSSLWWCMTLSPGALSAKVVQSKLPLDSFFFFPNV